MPSSTARIDRTAVPAELIADIYHHALESDGLPLLAEIMTRTADGGSAVILPFDGRPSDGATHGLPKEALEQYTSYYHWVNPWFYKGVELGVGPELRCTSDIVPEASFRQTEFYCDFAKPFDTVEAIGGAISLGPNRMVAVAVHRGLRRMHFDSRDIARLRQLIPHLTSALKLRSRFGAGSMLAIDLLDASSMGAVVCDRTARVVHANQAARTASQSGLGLMLSQGEFGLRAMRGDESRHLWALVAHAAAGQPGGAGVLHGRGGARLLVLVTPLPSRQSPSEALALVTFRSADEKTALTTASLQQLFGLTQAEADLGLALADGSSLAAVMAARDVTENTIRTQLGQVLRKTGTANQRELVRLLCLFRR